MDGSTIAAIASPPGPGARGIVRISGPGTRAIVRAAWVGAAPELTARALAEGRVDDGRGTQPVLCLWMPGPRSYTGEDVAELHGPGSPPLVAALLARVLALGAVSARPGEYTRRAFENGRIDLTRAEGVAELIAARDDAEARAAGALLFGGLGGRIAALRDALDDVRALCEASLDFDEADTGHVAGSEIAARARAIAARVDEALEYERARARSGGVPRVVLYGAPNAGKSSLANALSRGENAIVSDQAGTTRDTIAVAVDLDGTAAQVVDTPGADDAATGVDRAAQDAARAHVAHADVVLWVVDASAPGDLAQERARAPRGAPLVLAWNKVDRVDATAMPRLDVAAVVATSASTGEGIDALRATLRDRLAQDGAAGESGALARDVARRHVAGLERSRDELARVLELLTIDAALDLVAEHLRAASAGLDALDGTTTPEDLLDRIFARFCLGK